MRSACTRWRERRRRKKKKEEEEGRRRKKEEVRIDEELKEESG